MDVKTSTIDFNYLKRKYKGQVSMFQPAGKLMLRVYVPMGEKKGEQELHIGHPFYRPANETPVYP